jgi:hypothetical protein
MCMYINHHTATLPHCHTAQTYKLYTYTYILTYIHTYIYIRTYIHNTYIHIYIHTYIHIHTYIYTQIHTYIHTYIYIRTYIHTGEIGRLAVMHAGKRDFALVREIYQVNLVLTAAVTRLNTGNRFNKKLEMMNTNLRKVGDVIYELSMLQRSGRATRTKPAEPNGAERGDDNGDGNE